MWKAASRCLRLLTERALKLLLALVVAIPFALQPTPAAAKDLDVYWPGYSADIVRGGIWSRSQLASYIGIFDNYGMNLNFAYYSDLVTLRGSETRPWASREWMNSHSYRVGSFWFTPVTYVLKYDTDTFTAFQYGDSFVARCCGNFTPWFDNPAPPRISGYKWNDSNGDGAWDSGEPAISGWTMKLYRHGSLVRSTSTNSSGYYSFSIDAREGLLPDTYVVREADRTGWIHTTSVSRSIAIPPGSSSAGKNFSGNNFGNFELGSIAGIKWADTDADGSFDANESPVPGVTIRLSKNGSPVATAVTDSLGRYKFSNLGAGNQEPYRVEEVLGAGWQQTFPVKPPYYERTIRSGYNYTGCDFGNVQYGSIKPLKVHDRNMNQQRDPEEELLAGWTMRLWDDLQGSQLRDPIVTTEDTATTPAWEQLPSDDYVVTEDQQAGYEPTGPSTQTVTVKPGQQSIVTFFNVGLGDINGYKFHDFDRDGSKTAADGAVEGWRITLSQGGETVREALTDSAGYYEFTDLLPGVYRVCEEERAHWVKTTSVCETVAVTPVSSTRVDFGNLLVGDIAGSKFEDLNGDGLLTAGEPPVPDVEIVLATPDGTTVGVPTRTDAEGNYAFNDVIPGDYIVTEVLPAGWAASAGTTRAVTVVGGTTATADPFLNLELSSISGIKFDDCNANHQRDLESADETGLPGWEIELWSLKGDTYSLEQTTTTDAQGCYSFDGIWPGMYEVREVLCDGWMQMLEPGEPVRVQSGDSVLDQDFGNIELATLDLYKWDDNNSNGIWEAGEPGIPGWEFTISGTQVDGSTVSTVAVTGEDGRLRLTDLLPGTYAATEQTIGRTLETSGTVAEPGWRSTTPTSATIEVPEGSQECTSFGNIHLGWIWGRVTHEVYGHGVPSIPITLEETDETVLTNEQGYFFFYDVEPNETSETPTPNYLVGMNLTGTGYTTRDAVNKTAVVPEGGSDFVPFTVLDDGSGNTPRTIGYWKNWSNHYSEPEMQSFLDLVNAGSLVFDDLTLADVRQILQVDRKTGMEGKATAQFLAFWLNIASGNLGWFTEVNVNPVEGWETIVKSADENGITNVIGFLYDIEDAFINQVESTWELVKDLLDYFNNGRLT